MLSKPERENKLKAKVFYALSDPTRLKIINFLRKGEKCVCEITPHLGIAQPLVSRHLKVLKSAGLLKDRKQGNNRLYAVTHPRVFEIVDSITPKLVDELSKYMVEQMT